MNKRPLGPALGVIGGSLALYAMALPWLVIDPGGGFGLPVHPSGWPSVAIVGCAVALIGLALFSIRSTRDLRLWQVGVALAVPVLAVLTYSGPLMNALAEQTTPGDYFVIGWGPKVAVVGAVIAILGAVATTSRTRLDGEALLAVETP